MCFNPTYWVIFFMRSRNRKFFVQYFPTYFSNLMVLAFWSGCDLSGGTRTGCWCTWPSIILLKAVWYSLPRIYSHSLLRMIRFTSPTTTTTTTAAVIFQDTNNVNYVIMPRVTIFFFSLFLSFSRWLDSFRNC